MPAATPYKTATTVASFAPSRAFIEGMRPRGLVELGSAIAPLFDSARSRKLIEIGSSVAGIVEKAKSLTRGFDSLAFSHATGFASARANWFAGIEQTVNPLEHWQRQLGGVADIVRKIQPLHEQLAVQNGVVSRLARECHHSVASVVSKLDGIIQSCAMPWTKVGASTFPATNFFGLGSGLAHRLADGIANFDRLFPTDEEFVPLHDFLLARSWYLSLDLPLSLALELMKLHQSNDAEGTDTLLAAHARESLDNIELAVIAQFPHRRKVVEDAFNAHRQGLFTLSIPTLLLLVDGITHELWQEPFFCAERSDRRVRERLRQSGESRALDTWLRPLIARGAMREHTTRLPAQGATLNRHMVIHGLKPDYANELDSLKAIALLEFVRSISFMFEVSSADPEG